MKKAIIFLTDGFEELEMTAPADILRRAGVDVQLLSVTEKIEVTGSHDITVIADGIFDGEAQADMLILPGGPGAAEYISNDLLVSALKLQYERGGYIAAICAAPVTLGKLGFLKNKTATCYPAMEEKLRTAVLSRELVVTDGNITTARGPGAATAFGLRLAEILVGTEETQKIRSAMIL